MKIGALLYIETDISDPDLTFRGIYLPEELKKRLEGIESINGIYFSIPVSYSGRLKDNCFQRNDSDDVTFWKKLFAEIDADHIIKIFCDSPFLDNNIINEMIKAHTQYLAEFTYSENLPSGCSCEIVSRELIEAIPDSIEKTLPLSQVIRSNINQFDVELFYKEPDVRDKRITFRSGNPFEKKIMENIAGITNEIPKYSELKEIIDNNPQSLYVCPTYIEIELTGKCDLDCIFCYRNTLDKVHGDMNIEIFSKIIKDMDSFKLPFSICLGGSGEPLMHNKFYEILDISLKSVYIKYIIIETNGILADNNFKQYLVNSKDKRISVIFNINGFNEDTYKAMHCRDSFKSVFNNIILLKEAIGAEERIYIQIMKINETEPFLDKYYDFWEKYGIPIILQKQNTYLGRIEDRRYSDLSPIERTPCWHLHRDLNILSDGRVLFCKQDINGDFVKGSVMDDSLPGIFFNAREHFIEDYRRQYKEKPDCKNCDEWYAFNL